MTISARKKLTLIINTSILSAITALPLQANASDAIAPGDSDSLWVLGASAGVFNNPFIGEDTDAWISPNIRYNGERFFVKNGSLNLHIAKSRGFSIGLTAALDRGFLSDRSNYEGNDRLAGLSERDETIMGGFYINRDTDLGRLSFSAQTDLGDEHNGEVVSLDYTFDLNAGDWNINPVLGAQWVSDEYIDHYIGVSGAEAFNSLADIREKSTINTFAGVRARYQITDNSDVNLTAGVTKLGSGISKSSIIEDDIVYDASFGINYNF